VVLTYDSHRKQNEAPYGAIERLKDAERVGDVDADMGSPHDYAQSDVLERSDEVDDFLTCRCDSYRSRCQVRRAAVIYLPYNDRHT